MLSTNINNLLYKVSQSNRAIHDESLTADLLLLRHHLLSYKSTHQNPHLIGEAELAYLSGTVHEHHGRYGEAIKEFEVASNLYKALGNHHRYHSTLFHFGMANLKSVRLYEAITTFRALLNSTLKQEDDSGTAKAFVGLAGVYGVMCEDDTLLRYSKLALQYAQYDKDDLDSLKQALGVRSAALLLTGNNQEAFDLAIKFVELVSEKNKEDLHFGWSRTIAALAALEINRVDLAHQLARELFHSCRFDISTAGARAWAVMGLVQARRNNVADSLTYLLEAEKKLEVVKDPRLLYLVIECLMEMYKRIGDWQNVALYSEKLREFHSRLLDKLSKNKAALIREVVIEEVAIIEQEKIADQKIAALEQENRMLETSIDNKREVFQMIVHDLRNPLTILNINLGIIRRTIKAHKLSAPFSRQLTTIQNVITRMQNQVDNLYHMSISEIGEIPLNVVSTDLPELVSKVRQNMNYLAIDKDIQLEMIATEDLPLKSKVDRQLLEQALINLVSNAIKYSKANTIISIRLFCDETSNVIKVVDQGIGISSEELPNLFKKFSRLTGRPTRNETSSGLGLYVTKTVVEMMGGTVWAESEGVDQGASFIIQLPKE